jgi:hypothetical protein
MKRVINKKTNILKEIFKEVRSLRRDFDIFIPTESLQDYAHHSRIKNSLKKALQEYPRSI